MEPTLSPGDYLLARSRPIRHNDIVVFEHPDRAGFHMVKRVIAVEGERVDIVSGSVRVDGVERDPAGELVHTAPEGTWQIPGGHCFVLSDARTATAADSRTLGPIHTAGLRVVVFRYFPPGAMGRL